MSVDLKTLTPDTTIDDNAVLFGADSQSAASPSVYPVSAVRGHIEATSNTFTQPQVVTVNSSTTALRVTQTGSGNAFIVEDEANPDSTPFVIDANGDVIVGFTAPLPTSLSAGAQLGVGELTNSSGGGISIAKFRNNAALGPDLEFVKSRQSTVGGNTTVANTDLLGTITWAGADGTGYVRAASISSNVDATPGLNDMPGRLVFSTTASGASSPSERMRIDNAGQVGIGGTPTVATTLDVAKNLTGSAGPIAVYSRGVIQPDATGDVSGFYSRTGTAAASFTVANLRHFRAFQGTFGAGSSVTNQSGFFAESTLTGATNNFGFNSNIAAGTGRWNFFAGGTAQNYFAGKVGIGNITPAASAALDVTSTTAGVLFPRMTETQRDAIASPADGLVLYNTTTNKLQVRAGGAWVDLH